MFVNIYRIYLTRISIRIRSISQAADSLVTNFRRKHRVKKFIYACLLITFSLSSAFPEICILLRRRNSKGPNVLYVLGISLIKRLDAKPVFFGLHSLFVT